MTKRHGVGMREQGGSSRDEARDEWAGLRALRELHPLIRGGAGGSPPPPDSV